MEQVYKSGYVIGDYDRCLSLKIKTEILKWMEKFSYLMCTLIKLEILRECKMIKVHIVFCQFLI